MKNHLLLVGNGFVGKVTAELFRNQGWKVTTVSRSQGEADESADVSSLCSLQYLTERIDPPTHIVHCASASGGGVEAYRSVYLQGVKNLIQEFPKATLLFTSSTSVYPQTDGSVVTEESETLLERETGKLLLEAEREVIQAGGIVTRLAGIYGNGRSYLLRRFLAGEGSMEESGERLLNHVHHQDAASAIFFLLGQDQEVVGQVFNVCDSSPMSQKQTYQELSKIFNLPMPPSVPRNLNTKRGWSHKAVSNDKLLSLGWQPKYPSFTDAAQEIAQSL